MKRISTDKGAVSHVKKQIAIRTIMRLHFTVRRQQNASSILPVASGRDSMVVERERVSTATKAYARPNLGSIDRICIAYSNVRFEWQNRCAAPEHRSRRGVGRFCRGRTSSTNFWQLSECKFLSRRG